MTQKVPSFAGLHPASEATARVKRANRPTDTQHEILLRQALWHMGLRYRKNVKSMAGKPDIVFVGPRVVVFCDGDFWHGRNWQQLQSKLNQGTNAAYWSAKIATNIARDQRNTARLESEGWRVIRLWETDIKRDLATAAKTVYDVVHARRAASRTKPA